MFFFSKYTFSLLVAFHLHENNSWFASSFVVGYGKTLSRNQGKDVMTRYDVNDGFGFDSSSFDGDLDEELQKLDNAREMFERLVHSEEFGHTEAPSTPFHPPTEKQDYIPLLTESFRRKRELELEIVSSLAESDDGIEELINFWLVERDHESARKMKEMEQFCSPGHEREEQFLRHTIVQYGYHWVEPISRLAILLFSDERYVECEYWCKVALAIKPWHFEVIQTLIMNALKQNDHQKAQYWMERSLPKLVETEKRQAWVQQALKDAQDAMIRAQKAKDADIKKKQREAIESIESQQVLRSNDNLYSDDAWQ